MATITKRLSKKIAKENGKAEVLIRFRHGKIDQYVGSSIFIKPTYWGNCDIIVPNVRIITAEIKEISAAKEKLDSLCHLIKTSFQDNHSDIKNDWLDQLVNLEKYEVKEEEKVITFFSAFDEYLSVSKFSESRYKHFMVLYRTLQRYELHKNITIALDNLTPALLKDYDNFLRIEHTFFTQDKNGKTRCIPKYNPIYKMFPEFRLPKKRGNNYVKNLFILLRTFILWCNNTQRATNNPFREYKVPDCIYGTPIYITIQERNAIYQTDLSDDKQMEIQRDIFVFQCMIGCRVADLYSFTKASVINGQIEYIARKTKEGHPVTVEVPLNTISSAIFEKYKDYAGEKLFPFIAQQQYNYYIKKIFHRCGITRMVTVINPTTGQEEKRCIADLASSHLARRTFVGNLYKKVKDPNLVGSLSGHKEGSKAFARYRAIDSSIKQELSKLLEE